MGKLGSRASHDPACSNQSKVFAVARTGWWTSSTYRIRWTRQRSWADEARTESAGFHILSRPSTGVPLEMMGKKALVNAKFSNDILKLANTLEPFGLFSSAEANYEAASTGCIPMTQQDLRWSK